MSDLYTCNKHTDDYDFCPICELAEKDKEIERLKLELETYEEASMITIRKYEDELQAKDKEIAALKDKLEIARLN